MEHSMVQNQYAPRRMWLVGLIMLIVISGCNSSPQTTGMPAAISPSSHVTPKMAVTMPIIPTHVVTRTQTPVSTMLTSTSTFTSTPTWTLVAPSPTPGPTLTEADKESLVLDLLHNNGGCELPCWWGFTSGVTTLETVRDFFLSYGEKENPHFKQQNTYINGFGLEKSSFGISLTFFVDQNVVRVIKVDSGTSPSIGNLIYGDPFFEKAMQRYTLSQIFSLLGKPEQTLILVDENKDAYTFLPDYHILLFYPQNGVLVEYEGRSDTHGDQLQLCPAKTMISLWLWPPKEGLTLEEAYSLSAGYQPSDRKMTLSFFKSWEDISGKSIDDFVKTFKVKSACFNTPAALWGRK
jgi:hypothetical protein